MKLPVLREMISEFRANYRDNPFHNFEHAYSVTHTAFLVLSQTRAKDGLMHNEVLAALIACLGHDVDHRGSTNPFEVNSQSELAIRYSDDAVLERHHVATTFSILSKDKYEFVATLGREEYLEVRKAVIKGILATDMSRHFDLVEAMKNRAQVCKVANITAGLSGHAASVELLNSGLNRSSSMRESEGRMSMDPAKAKRDFSRKASSNSVHFMNLAKEVRDIK